MKISDIFNNTIKTRHARKLFASTLSAENLIYGEFEILYLLLKEEPLQPSKIGAQLHCEPAAVSRIIKLLSEKELITYEHDHQDRRQIFVRLTKTGKSAINSVLSHT